MPGKKLNELYETKSFNQRPSKYDDMHQDCENSVRILVRYCLAKMAQEGI